MGLIAGVPGPVRAARPAAAPVRTPAPAGPVQRALDLVSFGDPLPGAVVVSPFGLRQLPWEEKARLHAGLDIVAPEGAEVRAIGYGVVTRSGADSGYGRYVELQHLGGLKSFYAHLGAVEVAPGQTVGPGQALGRVGNTGSSTGAHLHFEMRNARGRPLDPAFFIGKRFARVEDWPLAAAARISPEVRIAVVSNIPESKLALMIARQEAAADEAAMQALAQLEAAEAQIAAADAVESAAPADSAQAAAEPEEAPEPEPAVVEAAPPPPPPEPPPPPPPPKRPATPPRLAMPD